MNQITLTIDGTEYACIPRQEYHRLHMGSDIAKPGTLAAIEKHAILSAFARHKGARQEIAAELGICTETVSAKLESYGMPRGQLKKSEKYELAAQTWWDMLSRDSRNLISRRVEIELGYRPSVVEMYEQSIAGQPPGGEPE